MLIGTTDSNEPPQCRGCVRLGKQQLASVAYAAALKLFSAVKLGRSSHASSVRKSYIMSVSYIADLPVSCSIHNAPDGTRLKVCSAIQG